MDLSNWKIRILQPFIPKVSSLLGLSFLFMCIDAVVTEVRFVSLYCGLTGQRNLLLFSGKWHEDLSEESMLLDRIIAFWLKIVTKCILVEYKSLSSFFSKSHWELVQLPGKDWWGVCFSVVGERFPIFFTTSSLSWPALEALAGLETASARGIYKLKISRQVLM